MRSCVKTAIPATGVTFAVSGSFFSPSSRDIVAAAANTLTLSSFDSESGSLRLRFEYTLPGRILGLEKLVVSGGASSAYSVQNEDGSQQQSENQQHKNLLVALYSENLLAVMRWSSTEHTFRNVALFALSVEEIDGAAPIVEGISSERSSGLPPLLRVDHKRSLILVLAQRRYIHSISMIVQRSSLDPQQPQHHHQPSKTPQPQVAKPKAQQKAAWADEDESSASDSDAAPKQQQQKQDQSKNYIETEDSFYANRIDFSRPKVLDLLAQIKNAKNIRDIHFVQGFPDPTVAILRENSSTWAGRVRLLTGGSSIIRALSCGVVIANFDEVAEKLTVVREVEGLPYSATQLCPLPVNSNSSLGGILCFSSHSVSHVTFRGTTFSAIVNELGRNEAAADQSGVIRWADMEFSTPSSLAQLVNEKASAQEKLQVKRALLAAKRAGHLKTFSDITATPVSETCVFVSHGDEGDCDLLDLSSTDNKTVSAMKCTSISPAAVTGAASVLVTLPSNSNHPQQLIFLGSKIHDSLLLQLENRTKKCSILSLFSKSLAAAVDVDAADFSAADTALAAEVKRFASERAKADDEANKNSDDALNPYADLMNVDDSPVLRPPPKPLQQRIKSSALVVASGALSQHSYLSVMKQHAMLDVVFRQPMDCTAIFSLASQNPSDFVLEDDAKLVQEKRNVRYDENNNNQKASQKSSSSASTISPRNPETVAVLFGASTTTAVVGTFGGKLTQIKANECGFVTNERTIAAFEIGYSGANSVDIFFQLTAKSLNLVSYVKNLQSGEHTFTQLQRAIQPPPSIADPSNTTSFRHAVLLHSTFSTSSSSIQEQASVLVLTEQGGLHLLKIDSTLKQITLGSDISFSKFRIPQEDRIRLMTSLTISNRRAANKNQNNSTVESSIVLLASERGDLYIIVNADSTPVVIRNFFHEFPDNCFVSTATSDDVDTAISQTSSLSDSTFPVEDMLLCRLHGESFIADDHLTLTVRRSSGEITVYGVQLPSASNHLLIWKKASLLHDVDKAAAAAEKFETIAEKKRKKELAEQNGQSTELDQQNNKFSTSSIISLPLGCIRLCYVPNIVPTEAAAQNETDAVFICGGQTSRMIVSDRGLVRSHPIRCPNGSGNGVHSMVRCAAAVNCSALSNGLILCESGRNVILCRFHFGSTTNLLDFRTHWPTKRIHIDMTPHFLVYNASNMSAIVVTSTLEPYRPTQAPYDTALKAGSQDGTPLSTLAQIIGSVEHSAFTEKDGVPIPKQRRFKLQMFCSGNNWNAAPASYDLLENEVVLACTDGLINVSKNNSLRPTLVVDGDAAEYIVLGTSFPQGDDVPCRGRILVFSASKIHTGGRHLTLVHAENTKAPVSAITTVGGLIVAAVGSSIRIFALDLTGSSTGKSSLVTCGFLSYATYITSLAPMKNYLVVGDIFQSVSFVTLRASTDSFESQKTTGHDRIVLLAQDRFSREITATGFVSSGPNAALVGADGRDNLLVLHYEPPRSALLMVEQKELLEQQQLQLVGVDGEQQQQLRDGDHLQQQNIAASGVSGRSGAITVTTLQLVQNYKLSGTVSRILRIRSPNPTTLSSFTGDNCALYTTLDGEIGYILPLSDREFRILRWASSHHTKECEAVGGLNVELERAGRLNDIVKLQGTPMVDLHHVEHCFVAQSPNSLRKLIARRAGSTTDKMLSMLAKIEDNFVEVMF